MTCLIRHRHHHARAGGSCARRNRPPPELDDLAAAVPIVVARRGPVLTKSQSQIAPEHMPSIADARHTQNCTIARTIPPAVNGRITLIFKFEFSWKKLFRAMSRITSL
jgi:hypothetical protein